MAVRCENSRTNGRCDPALRLDADPHREAFVGLVGLGRLVVRVYLKGHLVFPYLQFEREYGLARSFLVGELNRVADNPDSFALKQCVGFQRAHRGGSEGNEADVEGAALTVAGRRLALLQGDCLVGGDVLVILQVYLLGLLTGEIQGSARAQIRLLPGGGGRLGLRHLLLLNTHR